MSMNASEQTPEFRQHINHIKCDVKNCAYHSENDCCHAETIHVQTCTPSCCCSDENDTACKTFQEKR